MSPRSCKTRIGERSWTSSLAFGKSYRRSGSRSICALSGIRVGLAGNAGNKVNLSAVENSLYGVIGPIPRNLFRVGYFLLSVRLYLILWDTVLPLRCKRRLPFTS